jgi:hypothetical protein
MTQALYAHMNNKRKRKKYLNIELQASFLRYFEIISIIDVQELALSV